MGDRGNIIFEESGGTRFYFYTRWRGTDLPHILQKGMIRGRERWSDEPYLARILFSALVEGQEGGDTGFGISSTICDNEHDYLLVKNSQRKICRFAKTGDFEALGEWTFEEYCAIDFDGGSNYPWNTLEISTRAMESVQAAKGASDGI